MVEQIQNSGITLLLYQLDFKNLSSVFIKHSQTVGVNFVLSAQKKIGFLLISIKIFSLTVFTCPFFVLLILLKNALSRTDLKLEENFS